MKNTTLMLISHHDLDYQQFPDQHYTKTAEIQRANDWSEDYI